MISAEEIATNRQARPSLRAVCQKCGWEWRSGRHRGVSLPPGYASHAPHHCVCCGLDGKLEWSEVRDGKA